MDKSVKLQRREKEFRFRRAGILEQAEESFAAKGFHETTMAQIAAASGFSTGSLYRFFSGKEELYYVMVTEKVRQMYADIEQSASLETSTEGRIRALVLSHFGYVENHIDFYRLLVGHESGLRSEGLKKLREQILAEHRRHVDYIEALLREGIRKRVLRRLETRSLAHSLMGIVAYFKFAWIMNSEGVSLSGKVDDVLELFFRGASGTAGLGQELCMAGKEKTFRQEA